MSDGTGNLLERVEDVEHKLDGLAASVDERFEQVGQRFDHVDGALNEQRLYTEFAYERLDAKMDDGFARLDSKMDAGFTRLDSKMETGFAQVERRFAQIDRRFAQVEGRFAQIDGNFGQIDRRFAQMDGWFARLERKLNQFIDRDTWKGPSPEPSTSE